MGGREACVESAWPCKKKKKKKKKNGTNPSKFRPRTSSTWAIVGGKKTQFLGFFRKTVYTKMSLSHSDSWLAKKGDVRSTLVLRVDNFILGTQRGSIASEKTQFFLSSKLS